MDNLLKIPDSLDELPTSNVGDFISQYAKQKGIEYKRSAIDDLAEKITSLSGDDVVLDPIEKLLVTLAKKNAITKRQMLRLQLNYFNEEKSKRLASRRIIEQRIIIEAARNMVAAGCTISVMEGEKIILEDSSDPIQIESALHASGETFVKAKRKVNGGVHEGWVDFVGDNGVEIIADKQLNLIDALLPANQLAIELGVQRTTPNQ